MKVKAAEQIKPGDMIVLHGQQVKVNNIDFDPFGPTQLMEIPRPRYVALVQMQNGKQHQIGISLTASIQVM